MKRVLGIGASIIVLFVLFSIRPLLRLSDALTRGDNLVEKGEYDSAYFAYGDAIRRSPDSPVPYFKRAIAMSKAKIHSKTQIDLNDVIRLAPKFGAAYRLRAIAERALGLERKAQEDDLMADQLGAPTDINAVYLELPR